jgi:hypothetical protein
VAIAETHPPPLNARRHPELQLRELQRSVEMFGQIRTIVIDETGEVLAGNGLVEVFKRLGRDRITAYRVTGLTETQKRKLMLADNRVFDLGIDDYDSVMSLVRSLDDLDVPGYDAEILRRLTATSADVEAAAVRAYGAMSPELQQQTAGQQVPPGSTDPGASSPTNQYTPSSAEGIVCPKCGHLIPKGT